VDSFELQTLSELELLIPLLRAAPFEADLWDAQNTFYELMKATTRLKTSGASETWLQLFCSLGESLGIAVSQTFLPAGENKFTVECVPHVPELQLSASAE
jgi:hypothetical protein